MDVHQTGSSVIRVLRGGREEEGSGRRDKTRDERYDKGSNKALKHGRRTRTLDADVPFVSPLAGIHSGTRQEEVIDHRLTDREWAEEWKHLDHVRKVITFLLLYPNVCPC